MFDLLILHLKGAHPTLPAEPYGLSGFQNCFGKLYAYAIHFRKILADNYLKLSSSLSYQQTVWQPLLQHGICNDTSVCVTPNWDNITWNCPEIKTVLHLHGHCSTPSSLILPTETIVERALKGVLLQESSEKLKELAKKENGMHLIDEIFKHYTCSSSESLVPKMFESENIFRDWLSNVNKIVIAGLRFNDYDHELIASLSDQTTKRQYEIIIINRASNQEEQSKKVDTVAGLFSCSASDITFINSEKN